MNKEIFRALRRDLMDRLDLARELSDQEILDEIDQLILSGTPEVCLSLKEKVELRQELFHSVRKLDVLQELIEEETVTEIMVNGPDAIFVERKGKLKKWDKCFTSREKLEDVIQQIVGRCNRVVNEAMPIADARLENGARVNGDPAGCTERSHTYHPKISGYTCYHGKADLSGKSAQRMCGFSCSSCKGTIFHSHRWRNRKWQDYISGCIVRIYSFR